jgi:hypothetical protein
VRASPDPPAGAPSRRSVIVLGVTGLGSGLAALAGCSDRRETAATTAPTRASVTPDVRTATAALTAVRSAHEAVRATVRSHPGARAALADLDTMHAAHERSLVDAVPSQARASSAPASYRVPARPAVALARLSAAEGHLHDTLQSLALQAQSGEFARLLASMAAAVTVRRVALAGGAGR